MRGRAACWFTLGSPYAPRPPPLPGPWSSDPTPPALGHALPAKFLRCRVLDVQLWPLSVRVWMRGRCWRMSVAVGGRSWRCWRLFGCVGGGGHGWPGSLITADLSWWGGVRRSAAPPPPPRPAAAATVTTTPCGPHEHWEFCINSLIFSVSFMPSRANVSPALGPYASRDSVSFPPAPDPDLSSHSRSRRSGLGQVSGLCTLPSSSPGAGSGRTL